MTSSESPVTTGEPLDQKALGMPLSSYACAGSLLRKTSSRFWGTVVGLKSHFIVSQGKAK